MRNFFKSITVLTTLVLLLASCSSADTTTTFKVYGNCGMCQKTIEGSLADVDGVEKATWNMDTKMMTVSFEKAKITEDEIKSKIAAVGYDSDSHRAEQAVYDKLHSCCQYERPE